MNEDPQLTPPADVNLTDLAPQDPATDALLAAFVEQLQTPDSPLSKAFGNLVINRVQHALTDPKYGFQWGPILAQGGGLTGAQFAADYNVWRRLVDTGYQGALEALRVAGLYKPPPPGTGPQGLSAGERLPSTYLTPPSDVHIPAWAPVGAARSAAAEPREGNL